MNKTIYLTSIATIFLLAGCTTSPQTTNTNPQSANNTNYQYATTTTYEPMQQKSYTNKKYGYSFIYNSNWMLKSPTDQSPETLAVANFRSQQDTTQGESGFSFVTVTNPQKLTLQQWIKANPKDASLLPSPKGLKIASETIGVNKWDHITDNSLGYVPSGQVVYSTNHNDKLLYIVDFTAGKNDGVVKEIIKSLKWVD